MKLASLNDVLPGEHLVAIHPPRERQVEGWRRRLHLFTGRALADTALTAEQDWREGRLAMLGRSLEPGIIRGLDVRVEASGPVLQWRLTLTPGQGLTVSGEDLTVIAPAELSLGELPVLRPPGFGELPPAPGEEPTLADLVDLGEPLPPAALLLLEPVAGARIGEFDEDDPCERDLESEAFEDSQWIDGARLVLYPWPENILPLPSAGIRSRNRLAYALFELDSRRPPGTALPWEEAGLPLGLLHLGQIGAAAWDRYAAARFGGGMPKPIYGSLNPNLWRARLEQLTDHFAVLRSEGVHPADWIQHFDRLPAVGILPKDALLPRDNIQRLFPSTFRVEAVPMPLSQIDRIVQDSASLAPLDTARHELVRVALPVPPEHWDPALLITEPVDPAFAETISELQDQRVETQTLIDNVSSKAEALEAALKGEERTPDPTLQEDPDDPEEAYGTSVADGLRASDALIALEDTLFEISGVAGEAEELRNLGISDFADLLKSKIERTNDRIDLGFLRAQTNIYKTRQLILGSAAATRLATSPALASIARGESALSTRKDLEGFLSRIREQETSGGETAPEGGGTTTTSGGTTTTSGGTTTTTTTTSGGTTTTTTAFPDLGEPSLPGTIFPKTTSPDILEPINIHPFLIGRTTSEAPERETRARTSLTALLSQSFSFEPEPDLTFSSIAFPTATFPAPTTAPEPTITEEEVTQQSPIVGSTLNFRTTAIAERLEDPPAAETKHATIAGKAETLISFIADPDLAPMIDDLTVPGFLRRDASGNLELDGNGRFIEEARTIGQIRDDGLAGEILARRHDPDPADGDEASFFSNAVRALDHSIATLRVIEGRVQSYRKALELCRMAIELIQEDARKAALRQQFLDKQLAETEHDLEVGRSLLEEELQRVEEINTRRRRVIDEQVPFLFFFRPRVADLLAPTPARSLLSTEELNPVPACLDRHLDPPPELQQMIDLLREAPLSWLPELSRQLDLLDRLPVMRTTVLQARNRALTRIRGDGAGLRGALTGSGRGPLNLALNAVLAVQSKNLGRYADATARYDLADFQQLSWYHLRHRAEQIVSVGDLIDSPHGRVGLTRQATQLLEDITGVAACLYAGFAELLPALRLEWAQSLSQYDSALDLRNLSRLQGWEEVPFAERRELQTLVHWIYSRVDRRNSEAISWASDLVRVCILLASHAPVSEIIAGTVEEDITVKAGGTVRIKLPGNLDRVGVGLPVLIYPNIPGLADEEPAVRAVIEDLQGEEAVVRAVRTYRTSEAGTVRIHAGARVQVIAGADGKRGLRAEGGRRRSLK